MTELERAREHLRRCQSLLSCARGNIPESLKTRPGWKDLLSEYGREVCEHNVLAALSWVWEAQEQEKIVGYVEWPRSRHGDIEIYVEMPGQVVIADAVKAILKSGVIL